MEFVLFSVSIIGSACDCVLFLIASVFLVCSQFGFLILCSGSVYFFPMVILILYYGLMYL